MSDTLTVKTNNHEREIIHCWQMNSDQRAQFDYVNWTDCDEGTDSRDFVMYRGNLYDLNDNEGIPTGDLAGWDGYWSDSFFSGVVFRYPRDGEEIITDYVIMGTYYC